LLWFKDLQHTFMHSHSGRLFKTNEVSVTQVSPNEIHTIKSTGKKIGPGMACSFSISGSVPYAHFETMLKPWRRKVDPRQINPFIGKLPEVMLEDFSLVERFLHGNSDK